MEIIVLILLAAVWGGFAPALLFLLLAIGLLLSKIGTTQLVLILLLLSAIPLAIYISAALLERFCFTVNNRAMFLPTALAIGGYSLLNSESFFQILGLSTTLQSGQSGAYIFGIASTLLSKVIFCAALLAFSIMTISLLFELPFRWATGKSVAIPYESLRFMLVALALSLASTLIFSFLSAELGTSYLSSLGVFH